MSEIHATAVIAEGADIGDNCRIGPYCIIGPEVKLGADCRLHSHIVLDGDTTIGRRNEIFPFACIGKQCQDLKYNGEKVHIEIGENNTIREYVTIHQATSANGATTIGSNCKLMAYCHIAHDCVLHDGIIMSNSCNLAGHCTVEDNVVFGGMTGVHQFVRIGKNAMIGATAKVVQDVPPFGLVDGSPAALKTINKVGMQRNGFSEESVKRVQQAHKLLFRSNLTLEDAVQKLKTEYGEYPEINDILTFIPQAGRGLVRPKRK